MKRITTRRIAVGIVLAAAVLTAQSSSAARPPSAGTPAGALMWNTIAVNTVRAAAPAKNQVEGLIYMTYVQASVYDAITKIEGRYIPYHDFAAPMPVEGASPDAAVAAAAYTALAYYFPAQAGSLLSTYTTYVGGLPAAGRDAGVAIGQAAANDIIALRQNDGRDAPISTPYGQGPLTPGVWIFAPPPSLQSAQTPWVAFERPFTLNSPDQFRPGPPLRLDSQKYATQLAELHTYGGATGSQRTMEQTAVAQFWNANAINQVNETLRDLSAAHSFDLMETVRALAMGDMIDSDAGIACFDAKYHYTFWRPVTAINHADIDGNAATMPDTAWTSLLTTPNHPEYPAAHGCLTSADAEVYSRLLGTREFNVDIMGATNGATTLTTTRHYASAEQLDTEIVNARVWAGLHFRYSGETGVDLGKEVARWGIKHYFRPDRGDG